MYTVSQKPPTILFVYNSAKYWQALKKIHLWIQLEICNKIVVIFPPHLNYVATLPC